MRRAPFALGLLALAPFAAAQASNVQLGVSVNAYYFIQGRLRDALGSPAITYGVNLSALNRPSANKLTFAYDVISADKDGSRLFVLPFTVGYEKQFAMPGSKLLPYARLSGGVAYYDVALHHGDDDKSFKTFGGVGSAEVGVIFNRALALKAKYYLFQDRSGVNLSGAEIGLVYNFTKL